MINAEQAGAAPAETSPIEEEGAPPADPTVNLDAPPVDEGDEPAEIEPEPETDEAAEEPERRRPRTRYQRLKDRADRLERELSELRARSAPQPGPAEIEAAIAALAGPAPRAAEFADANAYHQSLAAHEQARQMAEAQVAHELQRAAAVEAEAQLRRQVSEHLDRVDAFRAQAPDFDEVVANASGVEARADIEELIVSSADSGRLLYHLLKNPALVTRLNALPPREAAREIGRIEQGIARTQPNRTTRAPSPFSSVRGGAAPSADPAKMEMEEYVRWRKSEKA